MSANAASMAAHGDTGWRNRFGLLRGSVIVAAALNVMSLALCFRSNFVEANVAMSTPSSQLLFAFLTGMSRVNAPSLWCAMVVGCLVTLAAALLRPEVPALLWLGCWAYINIVLRTWLAQDGGTNLLGLVLLFLNFFAALQPYGIVGCWRGRKLAAEACFVVVVRAQIVAMYAVAATSERQGALGSNAAPWSERLSSAWPELSTLGCYAFVAWQLAFLVFNWTPRHRPSLLAPGALVCLSIAAAMQLRTFAATMLLTCAAFLSEDVAAELLAWFRRRCSGRGITKRADML